MSNIYIPNVCYDYRKEPERIKMENNSKFFRRERDYLSRRLFQQTIRVAKQRRSIDRPTTMTRNPRRMQNHRVSS